MELAEFAGESPNNKVAPIDKENTPLISKNNRDDIIPGVNDDGPDDGNGELDRTGQDQLSNRDSGSGDNDQAELEPPGDEPESRDKLIRA